MSPEPVPDLEVPTAPKGFQSEPLTVLALIAALATGALTLLGAGGLDDGFQFNPDAYVIGTPVLLLLAGRQLTFSQKTVDLMVPRDQQARAVEARKAGVLSRYER